jgi:DNA-binding transcriptional ArsR family regulator
MEVYGSAVQVVLTYRVKYAVTGSYVMLRGTGLGVDERKIVAELTGSTALVYWYLLKKGDDSAGAREIMRALKFSSPSSATYHLDKLMHLGLIDKNNMGGYRVIRRFEVGPFKDFIIVKGHVVPRQLFYAVAASCYVVFFLLFFSGLMNLVIVIALLPAVGGSLLFWYETIILWKRKPSFL